MKGLNTRQKEPIKFALTHTLSHRNESGGKRSRGITLYEVVIAMAIFTGAMVALFEALSTATRAALQARLQSQAVLLAETKMAEVVGGVLQPTSSGDVAFTDPGLEGWTYSVNVAPATHAGVNQVQVTVNFRDAPNSVDASFTMARLLREQQAFVTSAIQAAKAKALQSGVTQQQSQATQ
jgi:general secretion pathway protein I